MLGRHVDGTSRRSCTETRDKSRIPYPADTGPESPIDTFDVLKVWTCQQAKNEPCTVDCRCQTSY